MIQMFLGILDHGVGDVNQLAGGIGKALEAHAGQIHPQDWEFYAVTAALFLTLAFPGFVYRYLLKRGR